ncbi:MAG: hypothetical protein U0V04_11845 [Spirosomataceae bacterium]|jgi:hypothetical protein
MPEKINNLPIPGFSIKELDSEGFGYAPYRILSDDSKYNLIFRWSLSENWDELMDDRILDRFITLIFNKTSFSVTNFHIVGDFHKEVNLNFNRINYTEKLNSLLEYYHNLSNYSGAQILFSSSEVTKSQIYRKFYFESTEEMNRFINYSTALGYTEKGVTTIDGYYFSLTFKGLIHIESIRESVNSNFCFIAKSFDDDLDYVHNDAIIPALVETGFEYILLKGAHVETNQTINDAIIAGIKKAKFTIVDFTGHKNGAYFEAGFALGRGQKVIYCCKKDDLKDAHFDTKPYQHIVWGNANDLKRQLIDKINAVIKE